LLLQNDPSLQQRDVETILKSSAIPLPAELRSITEIDGAPITVSWGPNAAGAGLAMPSRALHMTP
jgi:hypothetical protein